MHSCCTISILFSLLASVSFPISSAEMVNEKDTSGTEMVNKDSSNESTLIITHRKIPMAGLQPTTRARSAVEVSEQIAPPTTLTNLITATPGVAENSQPGIYQVVSIRGVSGQRILNFADGIKLNGERRAGVAASFIDPLLLEHVEVIRGPTSTFYGSGAIGGITEMRFARTEGLDAATGLKTAGNESYQLVSAGNGSSTASFVHRQAKNSKDVANNELNTHFEQTASYLQTGWSTENLLVDHWLFNSKGNDLGRSNSRYPDRVVNVPKEQHLLFQSALTHKDSWSLDFSLHDQSITTQTLRPEDSLTEVKTSSLDWAANWQTAWEFENESIMVGIDYNRRHQVNIKESAVDLVDGELRFSHTLINGELDETALFYAHHKQFAGYRLQVGGRYTHQQSGQSSSDTTHNKALTGFAGISIEINDHWEFNTNVGNSFRFASLTERFFSGTTARGFIQGNPELKPEQALTYDLGVYWQASEQHLNANWFVTHFSDYIERVAIDEEHLTYINQEDGTIKGLEIEYKNDLSQQLTFSWIATFISGKNSLGNNIADIPSNRTLLNLNYRRERYSLNFDVQHRFKKKRVGNGELPSQAATIADFSFSFNLNEEWQTYLSVENILDESYVSSTDDLATLSEGRNFGIGIRWQRPH